MEISKSEKYIGLFSSKGHVCVLDGQDKQMIFDLKVNEGVNKMKFDEDKHTISMATDRGKVYIYDIRMRRITDCLHD